MLYFIYAGSCCTQMNFLLLNGQLQVDLTCFPVSGFLLFFFTVGFMFMSNEMKKEKLGEIPIKGFVYKGKRITV